MQRLKELEERILLAAGIAGNEQERKALHEEYERLETRRNRLFDGCRFRKLGDLDAAKLEKHLKERREKKVLSVRTSNHVRAACKQLAAWAVERGLLHANPLASLKGGKAQVDARRRRRALTADELRALIRAAETGPTILDVPGPVRAWTYRLAAETGFRAAELCALRVSDFDLRGDGPSVSLRASATKNREEARIPLRAETARGLAEFLRGRMSMPTAPALPLPHWFKDKTRRWLEADEKRAGIEYETEDGFADFHALRGAFVTALGREPAARPDPRAALHRGALDRRLHAPSRRR